MTAEDAGPYRVRIETHPSTLLPTYTWTAFHLTPLSFDPTADVEVLTAQRSTVEGVEVHDRAIWTPIKTGQTFTAEQAASAAKHAIRRHYAAAQPATQIVEFAFDPASEARPEVRS